MKILKSIFVLSILFLSTMSFAQAPGGGHRGGQQGPPPIPNDEQIEKMVSDLAEEIALSDEQELEVLELHKEHFAKVKVMSSGNSQPKIREMESMKSDFESQVKAVLTKEQFENFEAFLKERVEPPRKR